MKKYLVSLIGVIVLSFFLPYANGGSPFGSMIGEGVAFFDVLTCEDYDVEGHAPIGITNFFDVTRSEALLWFNTTYVEGADVSVVWLLPSGAEYFVDAWLIPGEDDVDTLPWYDGLSSLSIMGESSSLATGRWRVEVYLDGVLQDYHEFNIIDRSSEEWTYFAEIEDVKGPVKSVNPNEDFEVQLVVSYRFGNLTVLTPGLWDPETEELLDEEMDEVEGSGTRTYKLTLQAPGSEGTYTVDAAAFYLVEDEWFIDAEGLVSFDVVVEKGAGGGWVIPGFPFEAVILGLGLSFVLLRLGVNRRS